MRWLIRRFDCSQRPCGANFGPAWRFGSVAAAIETATLAIVTNRLVFVTLLLTRSTSMATSFGTIAEIALSFLAIRIVRITILPILRFVWRRLLLIIRLIGGTGAFLCPRLILAVF